MAVVTITDTIRARMRFALQLDATTLDNDTIALVYGMAEEEYTTAAAITAQAHVLVIEALLFGSAKEVDYTQNQTQERASQRFDHLVKLLPIWKAKLQDAVDADLGGGVRWAGLNKKPTRQEAYPDE